MNVDSVRHWYVFVKAIARKRPELIPKHDHLGPAGIPGRTMLGRELCFPMRRSWHFVAEDASMNAGDVARFNSHSGVRDCSWPLYGCGAKAALRELCHYKLCAANWLQRKGPPAWRSPFRLDHRVVSFLC